MFSRIFCRREDTTTDSVEEVDKEVGDDDPPPS